MRIASCLEGRKRRFGSGADDNGKGSSVGIRYAYLLDSCKTEEGWRGDTS